MGGGGSEQESVISGQWSVISGQWSVVSIRSLVIWGYLRFFRHQVRKEVRPLNL
jgi:hypothetical protein